MELFRAVLLLIGLHQAFCIDGFTTLNHIKPQKPADAQAQAVLDLINRTIPERASDFIVNIEPSPEAGAKDAFQLKKLSNGTISITGTTGVAAATGFNYYLKYFCGGHISWETSQLDLPTNLPDVDAFVELNDRFRYYQNVCTTSYSFVWWSWEQWEKHIDWMVLNSFNLVLAFNGQEAIWDRVYQKFNLTDAEISEHFSGPAFLSWLRMGNMRSWGGPLSSSWHQRSLMLQKKILERMRSFGIITVLPGFAGHLPRAFRRLYPDANMVQMGAWNGFNDTYCCPYFLDPTEELFNEIGKAFTLEQIAEFGTDHVYNCDSFNENTPSNSSLTYLTNVGKSIYKAMTDADPDAIWMLQGWMFYNDGFWDLDKAQSILTSIPLGKMIVLDLQSEQFPQYDRLQQYFGQPYIWCLLHNFGGTLGMYGSSTIINEQPLKARSAENSTMVGTGLTPEGINQNYVIYDLMTESAWRKESVDLSEWFRNYTIRRYGREDADAVKAWQLLQKTIYDFQGLNRMRGQYAITRTPSLDIATWTWYSTPDLLEAWKNLLKASGSLGESPGYGHDLVDVTRQVLQVHGDHYYNQLVTAFRNKDIETFQNTSVIFLDIFQDLETILASNKDFLLGNWIKSAKEAADNPEDEELFEFNARNQITLWGPNGEIMNYANKQWSGVVSQFFGKRWTLCVDYMNDTLTNGSKYNQSVIKENMFKEVEEPFTFDRSLFPIEPKGNSVDIAQMLYEKWSKAKVPDRPVPYRRKKMKYLRKPNISNRQPKVLVVG